MSDHPSDPSAPALDRAERLFETHRSYLHAIAYRMLGSLSDTEDILQDAFLRLARVELSELRQPRAYLSQLVTRLCLDHLRSARVRREHYVGPWLPEPLVDEAPLASPAAATALREDISLALMFALERLSPLERAAFILHDVFDLDYAEVALALGREQAACRQLAARGRKHVREQRPRFRPSSEESSALLGAFAAAAFGGQIDALQRLLTEDVTFVSDGGGKVSAATRVVRGPERVAKLLVGIARKAAEGVETTLAWVNGQPGFVQRQGEAIIQAVAIDIREGRIAGIYGVRNPDKLTHLNELASD